MANGWKNKKVLVAGGTGLIGIPLVEMLIERGTCVRVVSLLMYRSVVRHNVP